MVYTKFKSIAIITLKLHAFLTMNNNYHYSYGKNQTNKFSFKFILILTILKLIKASINIQSFT